MKYFQFIVYKQIILPGRTNPLKVECQSQITRLSFRRSAKTLFHPTSVQRWISKVSHFHHKSISKYAVASRLYLPLDLQIAVATFCAICPHLWSFKCTHAYIYQLFIAPWSFIRTQLTCKRVNQVFACGHLDCSTSGLRWLHTFPSFLVNRFDCRVTIKFCSTSTCQWYNLICFIFCVYRGTFLPFSSKIHRIFKIF